MGRAIAASYFVYCSFDAFLAAAALHLIAGYILLGMWVGLGWGELRVLDHRPASKNILLGMWGVIGG